MTNRIRNILISLSAFLVLFVVIGGALGRGESASEKTYRDLGVYTEVLSHIKMNYVIEPDLNKVTHGAIRGLLESLDPYSTYFTPDQYKDFQEHPSAGPATIGVTLSKKMGFSTVVSVLPGGPAEKAGVKAGDLIDRINDAPTREMSVVQIDRLLAGQPGTPVSLSIVREVRGEPQTIKMTREVIQPPAASGKLMEDNAAYIHVATFNKGKSAEIAAKLKELASQGATKVVLDLRDCAGGEMDEAVKTASLFLSKGTVTYAVGQSFPREDFTAQPDGKVFEQPLAVLINQSTAGPAEVVASAILGNKRGEVVGTRSFGMGVVQKSIPVGDGSGLLLSVAKYYRYDGKTILDNGIVPSVVQTASNEQTSVDDDSESLEEPDHIGGKDDLQLQKALEVLKQASAKTS
ncbi:MAG TPA: S41 family peptidase [Terriglobia bacterium]|nr:S41 family peptidase [Terriglobia bacterium]